MREDIYVVPSSEVAFFRLAGLGELKAVAPGLDAVGFDFQVQALEVSELVRFVHALGCAA